MSKSSKRALQVPVLAQIWRYTCLCDWMRAMSGVSYVCAPETRQRCVARLEREASQASPCQRNEAVPPQQ